MKTSKKILEIFEIKTDPDDEMDRIILELYKRGFSVKKINAVNKEELKKYPDILEMIKSGTEFPIIRIEGKIINKKQLLRMANLPKEL